MNSFKKFFKNDNMIIYLLIFIILIVSAITYYLNNNNACKDLDPRCASVAKHGGCREMIAFSYKNCKKSCKFCNLCIDLDENCSYRANNGDCEKNPNYMLTNCMKSCNKCTDINSNTNNSNYVPISKLNRRFKIPTGAYLGFLGGAGTMFALKENCKNITTQVSPTQASTRQSINRDDLITKCKINNIGKIFAAGIFGGGIGAGIQNGIKKIR